MSERHQRQIQQNYEAFYARLPQLMRTHPGKFALMHDGEIVACFDTARDAYIAGQTLFPEQMFSIQEVTEPPGD